MKNRLIQIVEDKVAKPEVDAFEIGDTVDVHVRILEGNKERVQIFNGTVISRQGEGIRETFTVRRIVQGEVSSVFSPSILRKLPKSNRNVRALYAEPSSITSVIALVRKLVCVNAR